MKKFNYLLLLMGLMTSNAALASTFDFILEVNETGSGMPYEIADHQLHAKITDTTDPTMFDEMIMGVPAGSYTLTPVAGQPGQYNVSIAMGEWTSAHSFILNISHAMYCDSVINLPTALIMPGTLFSANGATDLAGCTDKTDDPFIATDQPGHGFEKVSTGWSCEQGVSQADLNQGLGDAVEEMLNWLGLTVGQFCSDDPLNPCETATSNKVCKPTSITVAEAVKTPYGIEMGRISYPDPTEENPNKYTCKLVAKKRPGAQVSVSASGCMCLNK